uniref:Uncharacterized protein n=1 Tax=Entomoneis paludosa TaxID=265537 RepID=A0A7S2YP97_9STRA|mmetsp:Transcript_4138/g.8884  ORF Transcript_4138/g.8884 Transcript_4138/m.8884 type:complete len:193 (+) Transcript_4138:263-841(+)
MMPSLTLTYWDIIRQTANSGRPPQRHLNGKKGGKKDTATCDGDGTTTYYYDGEQNPMVCDFPVKVQQSCDISQGFGTVESSDEGPIQWGYLTNSGYEAKNLENRKTFSAAPFAISRRATTQNDGSEHITFIGTAVLFETDDTSGLDESKGVPNGPTLLSFDGYFEYVFDAETKVYTSSILDATVIDICVELA